MFTHLPKGIIIAFIGLGLLILAAAFLFVRRPTPPSPSVTTAAANPASSSGITLSIYSGHTDVANPNTTNWQTGVEGQQLIPGAQVKTGPDSRAVITYPDGSVTRLDYNSQVTISSYTPDPQAVDVTVDSGRIWSRVAALLGKKSYQSDTNSVIASVRGTSYGHDHTGTGDQIITTEHNVDVNCQNQTQQENVPEGYKATFTCDTSQPPQLTPLSDADKQDEWYIFNHQQDLLMNLVFPSPSPTPIRVLGTTTTNSSYPPQPTSNLIDCVGPDGNTARSTQADCDNLWQFWNTHPPAEVHRDNPPSNNSSSTSTSNTTSSTPTPSPSPTPGPLTFTNVVCQTSQLSYIGCTHLIITGSGFASGINLFTYDDFEHSYPINSITITDDSNLIASMSADLCQADASYFDLTLSYPNPDNRQSTYNNFVPYCFQ